MKQNNSRNVILLSFSNNLCCFFFLVLRLVSLDSKQNGDAASAALANEDCPTIDQVLSPDERSPIGRGPTRERYQQDRACFLLNTREFRATDGNVRKGTFDAGGGEGLGEGVGVSG